MHIETRDLTEDELRAAIAAYSVTPRSGCSAFAFYGMYAVLVPTIGGGLIAQILRLIRVPEPWTYPIGLFLAACGSFLLFVGNLRVDKREREQRDATVESLRNEGLLKRYVASVEKAWEVTDYDHGPAYLVRVAAGHFAYISSFSPYIEAIGELGQQLSVSVAEPVGLVLAATTDGPAVPLEQQKLEPEDVSDAHGRPSDFILFTPEELPDSWRRAVTSSA